MQYNGLKDAARIARQQADDAEREADAILQSTNKKTTREERELRTQAIRFRSQADGIMYAVFLLKTNSAE